MVVSSRLDLRRRIALLVLAALLPALVIGLVAGLRERGRRSGDTAQQAGRIARLIAGTHQQILASTRYLLQTAALVPEIRSGDAAARAGLLRDLVRRFPGYTSLLATDGEGRVQAHSGDGPAPAVTLADRTYFRLLRAGGDFAVGDYAIGRISGRQTIHCAAAVRAPDGSLAGAVVAGIDLSWVDALARTADLPPDSVVTLIDRTGTILARTREPALVGSALEPAMLERLLAVPEGGFRASGPDLVERIYASAPLLDGDRGPVGRVVVGLPVGPAVMEAERGLAADLLLVLVLAVLALAVARLLARRLIEAPVQDLIATTGRLAAGDLAARTAGRSGRDEFALLAREVDRMAEALAKREQGRLADAEEIRRSRALLGAIIDAAPMAVFVLDGFGVVRSVWSRGAETLFGWNAAEVLDQLPPHVPPERRHECAEHRRRLAAGEVLSGIEIDRRRRDGGDVRVEMHAAPLRDEAGRCSGSVWMLVDVTQRRALQEQLQQAQKLELVGRLAGGVAHDFNNLLAVISGYSDLLRRRLADPVQRQQIEQIAGAAQRAAALTGRLLGFARRRPLSPQVLDLAAQIEDSARLLAGVVGERIDLTCSCQRPCPVLADAVQIDQVLMNLVINARDAMPGGGTISIVLARHGGEGPGRVELSVSDTGTGMSREVQERLYEPFFTTKPPGKGTGLGLATVRAIVADLGGVMMVESVVGQGSCFRIVLPLAAGDGGPRQAILPMPASVLVVDDDPAVLAMMEAAIGELGIACRACGDPLAALAALDGGLRPDLLITDLAMPGLDGASLARAARGRIPGLRVLVVSGYADEGLTRAVAELGGRTAMLGKPFQGQRLADAVRALMAVDGG